MNSIFTPAADHIRKMEQRIAAQKTAIARLAMERRDSTDARRRLALLQAALTEMRTQLAQLAPTRAQVAAPMWALRLTAGPDESA